MSISLSLRRVGIEDGLTLEQLCSRIYEIVVHETGENSSRTEGRNVVARNSGARLLSRLET